MNPRKIKEDLGRARTCIQRREYPRAVYLFCGCLKEAGNQAPTDVRGEIRTTLADLCADPIYKKDFNAPISYQPGKEKEILAFFTKFYKQLTGSEDQEDYEDTLARKLNLDRCLNNGKTFLTQNRPSDADDCFAEAFRFYKNEFGVYGMMARAMMDAGEYVRALGYVRKGLAEKPDDVDLKKLGEECARLRAQAGR